MNGAQALAVSGFYDQAAVFPIGKVLGRPARTVPIPLTVLIFLSCTGLVIFCDSQFVAGYGSFGPALAAIIAAAYLGWLLFAVDVNWLLPTLLFLPLSYLGEALFSLLAGYYHYRLGSIPLYVPIGHAILMCVASMLLANLRTKRRQNLWIYWLAIAHVGAVAVALIAFDDLFSFVYATMFFLLTPYRKRFTLFALLIGMLVLYVEVLGTWAGAWHWAEYPGGLLHAANPPVGAFVFYVIGKAVAIRFAERTGIMKAGSQPFY